MKELILNMPVHSTIWRIEFNESIITQSLIRLAFADFVPILKKVLISEILREMKLINGCHFLLKRIINLR